MPLLFVDGMAFGVLADCASHWVAGTKIANEPGGQQSARIARSSRSGSLRSTRFVRDAAPALRPVSLAGEYHEGPIHCPIEGESTRPPTPRAEGRRRRRGFADAKSPLLVSRCVDLRPRLASPSSCASSARPLSPPLCRGSPRRRPAPGLDGAWNMTAVNEASPCSSGATPAARRRCRGRRSRAGSVRVRSDGGEFAIEGGRRTLRTDECLDGMPTLARKAHSTGRRVVADAMLDPPERSAPSRRSTPRTFWLSGDNDPDRRDRTLRADHQQRALHRGRRATRVRRLRRGNAGPDARRRGRRESRDRRAVERRDRPEPGGPPDAARYEPGADRLRGRLQLPPGAPSRLEVRPSRKLLRWATRSDFAPSSVDAAGCLTGTPIQWAVGALRFKDGEVHAVGAHHRRRRQAQRPGRFTDATFDVVATAAGRSARSVGRRHVARDVRRAPRAVGSGPERTAGRTRRGGAGDGLHRRIETDAPRTARAQRRAIFIVRRGRPRRRASASWPPSARCGRARRRGVEQAAESRHAEKMREYERQKRRAGGDARGADEGAPGERRERPAGSRGGGRARRCTPGRCSARRAGGSSPAGATFCPFDSNRLVAIEGHQELMVGPSGGICPTCRRGFNPGVKVCPHDGDELVPRQLTAAGRSPPPPCAGKFARPAGAASTGRRLSAVRTGRSWCF